MKDKLYIYALILVLMLSLIGIQNIFISKIENRAIINNNIDGFIEYRVNKASNSISFPKEWKVTRYNDDDNMLEFDNKGNNINGKLEIIQSNKEVSEYINDLYDKNNTSILNESWYMVKIPQNIGDRYYYIKEYSNGKLLRLTFNIEVNNYKPSIEVVFDKIAESFK